MRLWLIILVIVLVLGGAGFLAWWLVGRDDGSSTAEPSTAETDTTVPSESSDDLAFYGTFDDAIARGQPIMCTWRAPEQAAGDLQVGTGTFYTDGVSRGYSEATFEVDGRQTVIEGVFNDNEVRYWQTINGTTLGFMLSEESLNQSQAELTPEEQASALDVRAQYDFDCQAWTVDESLFAVPEGIEFIEV